MTSHYTNVCEKISYSDIPFAFTSAILPMQITLEYVRGSIHESHRLRCFNPIDGEYLTQMVFKGLKILQDDWDIWKNEEGAIILQGNVTVELHQLEEMDGLDEVIENAWRVLSGGIYNAPQLVLYEVIPIEHPYYQRKKKSACKCLIKRC